MFKKNFMVVLTLVAVVVMAFGALTSGAWFTDQATSDKTTVEMGKLDMELVTETGTFTNAYPGQSFTAGYLVKNVGTLPIKYSVSPLPEDTRSDLALFNLIYVKIYKAGAVVHEGWLKDLDVVLNPEMAAGTSEAYKFVFTISTEAGNELQGAKTDFAFVFKAVQIQQ